MTKEPLGRLERVDLRKYWGREDTEFTPWLADPENIRLLGDTLKLDLEVDRTEADVGPFRADILCRDLESNTFVLIENQLERTDHSHLGQIITYASGLDAARVVWIAPSFTDEHRSALDWLNRVTGEHLHFFGVEVELWRIGNSPPAPRFNVVAKPNDWANTVREKVSSGAAVAERAAAYRNLWNGLSAHLTQQKATFRIKPTGLHWVRVDFGRPEPTPNISYSFSDQRAKFYLFFRPEDSPTWFRKAHENRARLEGQLGEEVHWELDRQWVRLSASFEGDPATLNSRLSDWVLRKVSVVHAFVNSLAEGLR
jgi:hypothetical protein